MRIFLLLLFIPCLSTAQYSREKINNVLTGPGQKTWNVTGINEERPEKSIRFNSDNTAITTLTGGKSKTEKWSLASEDNIRWFLTIGKEKREMIISYDRKGEQYIKLTRAESKDAGLNEIKLTPQKNKK